MQYRSSPFHRSTERDADVGRGTRISDFIRDARSDRDTLQLEAMQLPLALPATPVQISIPAPMAVAASSSDRTATTGIRTYDPAHLANALISQALTAIEQLGRLMTVNDEREKQLHLYDDAQASIARPSLDAVTRSAMDGCLDSATALLGVTRALYNRLPGRTPAECVEESRELTELTKTAGRSAYRAALSIVDPELQQVPRATSHRHGQVQS